MNIIDLIKNNKISYDALEDKECESIIQELEKVENKEFKEELKNSLSKYDKSFKKSDYYYQYSTEFVRRLAFNLRLLLKYFNIKLRFSRLYVLDDDKQEVLYDLDLIEYKYCDDDFYKGDYSINKTLPKILEKADLDYGKICKLNINYEVFTILKDKLDFKLLKKNRELDKRILQEIGGTWISPLLQRVFDLINKEIEPNKTYAIDESKALSKLNSKGAKIVMYSSTTYYGSGITIYDGWQELNFNVTLPNFIRYEFNNKYWLVPKTNGGEYCRGNDYVIIVEKSKEVDELINILFKDKVEIENNE